MQRFTELKVWERSHRLALQIYQVSKRMPADERFGLIPQLRRALVSVPTNIAEGSKRTSSQEYARFLNIAEASLAETEYLLILSRDLGYESAVSLKTIFSEVAEIAGMLHRLRLKVEGKH